MPGRQLDELLFLASSNALLLSVDIYDVNVYHLVSCYFVHVGDCTHDSDL